MGTVIEFPNRPRSWQAKVSGERPNPTRRRSWSASRRAKIYLDIYRGDELAGMVSIDRGGRVLAWSEDWSNIVDQPDVATAVEAIRSGAVRNEARR